MKWDSLTSAELAALDRSIPVILGIAAIEQHGPHLPLSTDAAIGGHFLDKLDEEISDEVVVLPQVKVGCSEHHMDFAGTLTVRHESFIAYVSDIVTSAIRHGFRNIVLFNSHGGNQAVGQILLEQLGAANRHCQIAFLTWWRLAGPGLARIRQSAPGGVGHACEFETSIMLHIGAHGVRRDLIGGLSHAATYDWAAGDMLEGERGTLFRTMAQKTNGTGTAGDPSLASAEKGEAITKVVVPALVEVVRTMTRGSAAG